MTFGTLLESLLTATKTKKKELASQLGYDPSLVSKWVRNQTLPSRSHYHAIVEQAAHFFVRQAEIRGRNAMLLRALPEHDENITDPLTLVETALFEAYQEARTAEEGRSPHFFDGEMVLHASSLERVIGMAVERLRKRSDEEAQRSLRVHALLSPQMIESALSYLHDAHNFAGERVNFDLYQYAPASQLYLRDVSSFLELATLLYRWNANNNAFLSFDGSENAASFIWIEGFCVITETKVYNAPLYTLYPEKIIDPNVLADLRTFIHKKRNYHAFSVASIEEVERACDVCLQSKELVVYNPPLHHHFMAFAPDAARKDLKPEDVVFLQYVHRLHQHIITHPNLSAVVRTAEAETLFKNGGIFFNGHEYKLSKEIFAKAFDHLNDLEQNAEGTRHYYITTDALEPYELSHTWVIGDQSALLLRLAPEEALDEAGMLYIADPLVTQLLHKLIIEGPAARSMNLPPLHYYQFMKGILNERWHA